MKTNPVIIKATVINRAERDLIARHEKAMKEIERWDIARELRPHTPRLANEVLRREACDWEAPVIQAMCNQAGPRTGTHPMAVPIIKPMATRLCPALHEPKPAPSYRRELLFGAVNLALIGAGVAVACYLSR